jgi:hypothetical protein
MTDKKWQVVTEVDGGLRAELLRGLLEAQGFEVLLSREGAERAIGLTTGKAQILVPKSAVEEAKQVLEDYYSGKMQLDDDPQG